MKDKSNRKLKDSGIEWIGKVPTNWKICKSKYCFECNKKIVGYMSDNYDRLSLTLKGVLKRDKEDSDGLQPTDFTTYQIVNNNELIFKLIDLKNVSTSRVGLSSFVGIVSPAYIILKQKNNYNMKYAEYYYLSMWMNEVFNTLGDAGVRSSINSNELLNLPIIIPSIEEQKRIADFLDNKCYKIDKIINDINNQVEKLEKYKNSIVAECVSAGINLSKNVKKKISWLSPIVDDWEVARIGSLYKIRNEKVSDYDYPPLSVTMKGIVPQLDTAAKTNAHEDRKLVLKGDFAINSRSDRRGSCGISDYDGSVSLINTVITPIKNMSPRYYNWLFHTEQFADEFYKWGHGIVNDLWTTSWSEMKNIKIPVPPIKVQQDIANYLDKKCKNIDCIIEKKLRQLEIIFNYKKSLIFEYVTGKKQV